MKKNINFILVLLYLVFIILSFTINYDAGIKIGNNFLKFAIDLFKIIPCAFILIGLFEVWVKKETVEKHLGEKSVFFGYFWVILLASTTVGGLYVAFPVAYSLYKKNARLSVLFTYLGAAAVCRIPMTIFEASFLGLKFTLIRLLTSIPLIIISSILLEYYLKNKNLFINNDDNI